MPNSIKIPPTVWHNASNTDYVFDALSQILLKYHRQFSQCIPVVTNMTSIMETLFK